jgi:hypothetical protein
VVMKFKLWIATNADGRQRGFIGMPVRIAVIKEWFTEGPDFRTIDFDFYRVLPQQTWRDDPVLVEVDINVLPEDTTVSRDTL